MMKHIALDILLAINKAKTKLIKWLEIQLTLRETYMACVIAIGRMKSEPILKEINFQR